MDKLNKKTYNLANEESIIYKKLLNKVLEINGISWKYIMSRLFVEKNYYSPVCSDTFELEEIINYRSDSLNEYYGRLRSRSKKRKISKFLARPFIGKKK